MGRGGGGEEGGGEASSGFPSPESGVFKGFRMELVTPG